MQDGYIKLFRKIQDNALWKKKPFDHARAWIDLILLANHKDGGYWLRGIWVEIKRGQVGWSEIALSKRWGWSRGKSRLFFDALKVSHQISQQNGQQNKFLTSCITIVNYKLYQGNDTAEKTAEKTAERQQKDSRLDTNNKEEALASSNKNEKNEKKTDIREPEKISNPQDLKALFKTFWDAFPAQNGKKLDEKESFRRFCELTDSDKILIIQAAKNYANSQRVKEGVGIKDPKNFIGTDFTSGAWRDWLEPELSPKNIADEKEEAANSCYVCKKSLKRGEIQSLKNTELGGICRECEKRDVSLTIKQGASFSR